VTPTPPYKLLADAIEDIDAVSSFIAEDNPDAALRFIDNIFSAIEYLASFPHLGHINEKIADAHIRFYAVYEYFVVYAPDSRPLTIIAIVHGRRNPNFIAAMLREREKRN